MNKNKVSRRDLMRGAAALAAASVLPGAAAAAQPKKGPARALRIAHITDVHLQPEKHAAEGFTKCLHHLQSQAIGPDIIFNGGDSIMDAFGAGAARVKTQWKLFKQVLQQECSLDVVSAIGNHDIWGWDRNGSSTTGHEPMYGKHWSMDELGLTCPYYSFDRAGWHFIVLDSIHAGGSVNGYCAKLNEDQFDWLESDLASVPLTTPVMIMSHVPILSVAAIFMGSERRGYWNIGPTWMHIDARRFKDLFLRFPNVKLCISGHEHLAGKCAYNGVGYACNGAVCGAWWGGAFQETEPGYGVIDLYADGTFKNRYVKYGWKPA